MPKPKPTPRNQLLALRKNLAMYIKRWRRYPLAFYIEALQAHKYDYPNHHQAVIFDAVSRSKQVCAMSYHGLGKSRLLATLMLWWLCCFKKEDQDCRVIVVSPTEDQNTDVIWTELANMHKRLLPSLKDEFRFVTEGYQSKNEKDVWFATPRSIAHKRSGNIHGYHNTLYLFDEAPGIRDDQAFASALGATSQSNDRLICMGNPVRTTGFIGRLYRHPPRNFELLMFDGLDNREEEVYEYPYIKPNGDVEMIRRNGMISQRMIDNFIDIYGEHSDQFRMRVRGLFPLGSSSSIISREWCDQAMNRPFRESCYDVPAKRILGCDPAGEGADASVFIVRYGPVVEYIHRDSNMDTLQASLHIASMIEEFKENGKPINEVCIDTHGLGAGVVDNCKAFRSKYSVLITPVQFFLKPPIVTNIRFYNLYAYLWYKMRAAFQLGNIVFKTHNSLVQMLMDEISVFEYDNQTIRSDKGYFAVEPKRNVSKRLGRSPDLTDALLVTYYSSAAVFRKSFPKKNKWNYFGHKRFHQPKRYMLA